MPRLTIPEPKEGLFEQGFGDHDKLSRKEIGGRLSELVERINDPLVIALDGAWGSGKSFFLKCWVYEHVKEKYKRSTETVYFDAFAQDYLDDPLIDLTAAISERIEREPQSPAAKTWKIAKNAAPFLGKAAFRLGTAALVGKAISLTGEDDGDLNNIGDKLSEEGGEISKSLTEFWMKEDGRRAAMSAFKGALVKLTDPDGTGSPKNKLIIVVDELDRCRPDYALSLLETTKHVFDVEGVHFVLGVNLTQLQNSVKARYGSGTEAEAYLQKFYSLKFKLPRNIQYTRDYVHYFNYASAQMQIPLPIHKTTRALLELYSGPLPMTLRTTQRILSALALLPLNRPQHISDEILVAAAIVKVCAPQTYELMRENKLTPQDLQEVFNFDQSDLASWTRVLRAAQGRKEVFGPSTLLIPENLLPEICDEYLEVFDSSALQIG
ncbi:P-loop NTPase fold protein [uncultured Ruegeria sp.]|uniref:KAP family P-loop NTPase fold protein n=1 Tax=uncultured Ruegeria sp. TaxID=259304 RepID=UPI0026209BB7|nr:P-loop NTPase fold protein [uncultured Ruegeria sp.]